MDADNREVFLDLAREVYKRVEPHGGDIPDDEWLFTVILAEYDPVTKYIYENEVIRKREYLAESVNASAAKSEKSAEFKRGLKYWSRMSGQYADTVTDKATLKAFKDAGVKYVMWHTEEDDRVCEDCEPLDKKVFAIDKVPPKQHWGCRCWLEAVEVKA